MVQIASLDAQRQFQEILQRVSAGESFVITHNGEEAARLIPPGEQQPPRMSVSQAIQTIRALRPLRPLALEEIKDFIEEGRRF